MAATHDDVPAGVRIIDVFPRDGLQAMLHSSSLRAPTTEEKLALIGRLDRAGVPEIEITGFVHPRVIPSLADADELSRAALAEPHRATYRALVPNVKGAERALAAGMPKLNCLVVASDTYQRLNANMTLRENLDTVRDIVELAAGTGVELAASIGAAFICPYEGILPQDELVAVVEELTSYGFREIGLADSVGLAWPALIRTRVGAIRRRWPELRLALHLHTLAGTALLSAFVAFEEGVTIFEGAIAGIGSGIAMPVHAQEMGNVATEDLVYLFEQSGVSTGIDVDLLGEAARAARTSVGWGSGRTTDFGSLSRFVQQNREALAALSDRPPGRSSSRGGGDHG